jgi:hydroxypyruvate isomerase
MPQFAANLNWLYIELSFADRFAAAARDGFKAVELLSPYALPAAELKTLLSASGLQLVLLNTPPGGLDAASIEAAWASKTCWGTACLPGREAEFNTGLALALDYAQQLNCPRIHVMAGVRPEGVTLDAAHAAYVNNLRHAAAQAAAAGVDALIEPINTRDIPAYFLNRQDQAHAILDEIGAANLKVQMDLYHCQIMEGDLATKMRRYLPTGRIGHIQIAGVPGRNEPDLGEVNYRYLFALLDELGYSGWVGCEYRPVRGAVAEGTSAGLGWIKNF